MFIVLTGTPAHDSTGLHSSTRPIKMCPFSSTLMKDTLSRVTEGKSHVILNKDMVYPGVVLYIRLSTSTYIHPRREKVFPLLTVLARSVTATVAAFHSIWIRDRASFSTSERSCFWLRAWEMSSKMDPVSKRIRCARMQFLSFITTGDDRHLTVFSESRNICNTCKACSSKHPHAFFIQWSCEFALRNRLEGMFFSFFPSLFF